MALTKELNINNMDTLNKERLLAFLNLLRLHRGEAQNAYDEVASVYDSFVKVWDGHIAAPAMEYYNQLITQHVKPGAVVLDAGAGTGERTLAILKHGQPTKIIALDASEKMLGVARSKLNDARVEFKQGDLNHLPFEDNTFDVVCSTWVIEIMDDPRAAVQELIRVIKPEGVVLYAFCSLLQGTVGHVLKRVIDKVSSTQSPLTHLLDDRERPFHHCEHSSLKQFAGGLTTVATVAKCCTVTAQALPCQEINYLVSPPPVSNLKGGT